MAKTYNRLVIDVNQKPNDIITAVQADSNSRYLDVSLYSNGTPLDLSGHEVKIFMQKPENGGEIWNDGVITDAPKGRCEFLMTAEALSKMGYLQAQVSVWKENTEILSTQIFEINVTKTLLGNSSVEASNEYGTLVVLFQNLYEAYELMTTMVENIGVPAAVAQKYDLNTMWQAWEFLVAYMKGDFTDKVNEALANASVQGVLDRIGNTDDTGGSSTVGTLMAKSNTILKKVTEGRTLYPSEDIKKAVDDFTTGEVEMLGSIRTYYKIASFLPNVTGTVRIKFCVKLTVPRNTNTGGSYGSAIAILYTNYEKKFYDVIDGTAITPSETTELTDARVNIGAQSLAPAGTSNKSEGSIDVDVTAGIPLNLIFYIADCGVSYNGCYVQGDADIKIAYKEVSW